MNSSRSAYACFLFAINFFQSYDDSNPSSNGDGTSEDGLKCKLSVKVQYGLALVHLNDYNFIESWQNCSKTIYVIIIYSHVCQCSSHLVP